MVIWSAWLSASSIAPKIKGSGVQFPQRWSCLKALGNLWIHTVHPAVIGTRWNGNWKLWMATTVENCATFSPVRWDWKSEFQYLGVINIKSAEQPGISKLLAYTVTVYLYYVLFSKRYTSSLHNVVAPSYADSNVSICNKFMVLIYVRSIEILPA